MKLTGNQYDGLLSRFCDSEDGLSSNFEIPFRSDVSAALAFQEVLFSRSDALREWPGLDACLSRMRSISEAHGYSFDMAGRVVSRKVLMEGVEGGQEEGEILILHLPSIFEESIAELAAQKPVVVSMLTLDKLNAFSVLSWSCSLPSGESYSLSVSEHGMYKAGLFNIYTTTTECGPDFISKIVPILFVSGESVARGELCIDEDFVIDLQVNGSCARDYRPIRVWNEFELEDAAREVARVGTSQPWIKEPWFNKKTDEYELVFIVSYQDKSYL